MSVKKSRRQFILDTGSSLASAPIFGNALKLLFAGWAQGVATEAYAQSANLEPRRYVNIQQPGAPSRWQWDLFLTPYTSANYIQNPMLGNRYTSSGGRYTGVEYATININGINAPFIWGQSVPRAGGGTRPMSELLQNLLVLQGIDSTNPGHPGAQRLHFEPAGAVQSIPALAADAANAPIAALNADATGFIFRSTKGRTAMQLFNSSSFLDQLLNPFTNQAGAGFLNDKDDLQSQLNSAISSINSAVSQAYPESGPLEQSSISAENLLNLNFVLNYDAMVLKYQDLIDRTLTTTYPGINDLPIGTTSSRGTDYQLEGNIVTATDIRDLIVPGTTTVRNLATHFAITEYALTNNLTYSITISPRELNNLSLTGNTASNNNFDEHTSGNMPTTYLNTMYYCCFASCLLELIDALKLAGIFNDTVIDVGGEFNRNPRQDSSGSDHGWQGKSVSLWSGAISGPTILGNLAADDNPPYPGTWGKGAVITDLGEQMGLNHMAATIATLLRTASPINSASSLVALNGATYSSLIETSRIVP